MPVRKWNKISEKTIFRNKFWNYNLDQFEIEGGAKGEYHYVHTLGSTLIIPFLSENELLLVNQFRYLNQKESIEFPCGSIETGLSIEENAIKELREETGYSGEIERIGSFSPYTGASDEICSVFIARNLHSSPLTGEKYEETKVVKLTIEEFSNLISQNKIWDGMTLASWVILRNHLDL